MRKAGVGTWGLPHAVEVGATRAPTVRPRRLTRLYFAAAFSSSALSVRSQVMSGSSLPKWP